jgi:hypothetical protein
MSKLMLGGVVLVILGVLGFAVPYFTTSSTDEVAKVGDVKLEATEHTTHVIPPIVAGGLLLLGIVMLGAGVTKRS